METVNQVTGEISNGKPKPIRAKNAKEYQEAKAAIAGESNRDKFERVATRRTKAAVKALRKIAQMGGRSYYEFGQDDADRVVQRLTQELAALTVKLVPPGRQTDIEFDFK